MKKTLSIILIFVFVFMTGSIAALAAPVVPGGSTAVSSGSGSTVLLSAAKSSGGIVFIDPDTNKPVENETPTEYSTIDIVSKAPTITKNPTDESVDYGDDVVFVAMADYYTDVTWFLTDGTTYIEAAAVGDHFKGVTATGTNSERLVLSGVTDKMDGWSASARFNSTAGETWSNPAKLNVSEDPNASPSPTLTPTPTPVAVTPTPIPANASTGGTAVQHGTGSNLTSGTSVGNSDTTAIGTASSDSLNNTISVTSAATSSSAGTARNSHVGAYILASVAGLVIIGSVLIMALYMKGKISLGKFEKFLGSFGNEGDTDIFDESSEFYNPDDFKDRKDQ